eukprot:m.748598 g.748598  ORF g.748598 m.748598 type:complete len:245 (+) comp58974_c0_seq2:171-905(+)
MGTLKQAALAYAATTMAEAMMAVLFDFYYVDLFLNVYGVDRYWFYASEMLYMSWNAINDPLCAWLQDHADLGSAMSSVDRRKRSILNGSILFAISFLIPWVPLSQGFAPWVIGIHLTISLVRPVCLVLLFLHFLALVFSAIFAAALLPGVLRLAVHLHVTGTVSTVCGHDDRPQPQKHVLEIRASRVDHWDECDLCCVCDVRPHASVPVSRADVYSCAHQLVVAPLHRFACVRNIYNRRWKTHS